MERKSESAGFTLIHFVILIALLGVLAAMVLPRMIHFSVDAQTSATYAVASSLSAANTTNYAERSLDSKLGSPILNCASVGNLLTDGLPFGYYITPAIIPAGVNLTCDLYGPNGTHARFQGTGIY